MHEAMSRLQERIEELALWIFETREETRIGLSGKEKRIVDEIEVQRRRLEEAMDKRQEERKKVESKKVESKKMEDVGACVFVFILILCPFITLWVFVIKR